jgi:purine nucleosidase
MRLILDTDLGTDVDDLLALAVILGSPELSLGGITTVYGDVLLRARLAARFARIAGREVGPIVPGRAEPRSGREVFWPGHEGSLYDDLDAEVVTTGTAAAELLTGTVAAIGPLTNLADAVGTIDSLCLMAGEYTEGTPEHNVRCDVDSAAAVFGSGVPAVVIGLDQTTRLRFGPDELERIESAGEPGRMLGAEMRLYGRVRGREFTYLHDPAAVLMLTNPELYAFATGEITVAADGVTSFRPDPGGPHRIVTDLDVPAVTEQILRRLTQMPFIGRKP